MSILSKIFGGGQKQVTQAVQEAKILANRFMGDGGFMPVGAVHHAPRTNTSEEIVTSLKLLAQEQRQNAARYAKENLPEHQRVAELKAKDIEDFLANIDGMPQRHLSLAHDVVDLSNTNALINRDIFPTLDYNVTGKINGQDTTLMGYILKALPRLSKENPKAVDLAETVVSHSDDTNAKFFLNKFVDFFPMNGTAKQAEATEPLVENLSQSILKGMPSMNLGPSCKEQTFFNVIYNLCDPTSKPENIRLLKQTIDVTDNIAPNVTSNIDLTAIRLGDTEKIAENMKVLPQVLENAEAQGLKSFDVSGFLTKNVNLN